MLQYVIDSFQHRDVEFNDATFPSLTTGYCQRIKSQLCLKWYNKYTVQGRFLSCWSGKLVFTFGKSAPKPEVSLPVAPSLSRQSPTHVPPSSGESVSRINPPWAMCPALWIQQTTKHQGRLTTILIIIIIIKITSPTDASFGFHFTEVKMNKKKTRKKGLCQLCELSSGLDSTMMEGRRTRCDRKNREGWPSPLLSPVLSWTVSSPDICLFSSTAPSMPLTLPTSPRAARGQWPWHVLQHICRKYARLQNLNFSTSGQ